MRFAEMSVAVAGMKAPERLAIVESKTDGGQEPGQVCGASTENAIGRRVGRAFITWVVLGQYILHWIEGGRLRNGKFGTFTLLDHAGVPRCSCQPLQQSPQGAGTSTGTGSATG